MSDIFPRYKEVWRVEYAWEAVGVIVPKIEQRFTRELALAHAKNLGPGATCISVTGPHKQRIPV